MYRIFYSNFSASVLMHIVFPELFECVQSIDIIFLLASSHYYCLGFACCVETICAFYVFSSVLNLAKH